MNSDYQIFCRQYKIIKELTNNTFRYHHLLGIRIIVKYDFHVMDMAGNHCSAS